MWHPKWQVTNQWVQANQGIDGLTLQCYCCCRIGKQSFFFVVIFRQCCCVAYSGKLCMVCIMQDVINTLQKQNSSEDRFLRYPTGNMHRKWDGTMEDNLHATTRIEKASYVHPMPGLYLILNNIPWSNVGGARQIRLNNISGCTIAALVADKACQTGCSWLAPVSLADHLLGTR